MNQSRKSLMWLEAIAILWILGSTSLGIGIEISPEYAELIKKRLIWGFDPNIEWKVD